MSLNVGGLLAHLGSVSSDLQAKMESIKTGDGETASVDEATLLKLQMDVSHYQQIVGLTTAIISDVKQAVQGVIQKI